MVTLEGFAQYLRLLDEEIDSTLELCLKAAKSKALVAGIKDFKNNAQYDYFIYSLAGHLYDNRNLETSSYNKNDALTQRMINSFILELRYAEDNPEDEANKDDSSTNPEDEANKDDSNNNIEDSTKTEVM